LFPRCVSRGWIKPGRVASIGIGTSARTDASGSRFPAIRAETCPFALTWRALGGRRFAAVCPAVQSYICVGCVIPSAWNTSMHWLKVCVLLILTLAAMRATSWAVAWAVSRLTAANVQTVAVTANLGGLAAFVSLLYLNMLPGEPVDWAAMLFGLLVFVVYTVTDLFWRPWAPKVGPREAGGRGTA
jgi:hypothetical protein